MNVSRFSNNPDVTPLHSSGLVGDGAATPQPFVERQQLERHRQIIQGYHQSLVGSQSANRGRVSPKRRRESATGPVVPSRQEFNSRASTASFKEPPARGYNPYS